MLTAKLIKVAGSHEVRGSIHLGSTIYFNKLGAAGFGGCSCIGEYLGREFFATSVTDSTAAYLTQSVAYRVPLISINPVTQKPGSLGLKYDKEGIKKLLKESELEKQPAERPPASPPFGVP